MNSKKLPDCPDCGESELQIESSRELQISQITCGICDFKYQKALSEVSLIKDFKKHLKVLKLDANV